MKVEKNGYEFISYQDNEGLWISVYKGESEIMRFGATSSEEQKNTLENCLEYMDKYGVDSFEYGLENSWWRLMTGIF